MITRSHFALIFMVGLIPVSGSASPTFELGEIQQATSIRPTQYVIPVAVAADGYSTFGVTIVSSHALRRIRKWKSVERDWGVDVVITTEPITTPAKITLIAQYQGRERAGEYLLKPVVIREEKTGETANAGIPEPKLVSGISPVLAAAQPPIEIEEGQGAAGGPGKAVSVDAPTPVGPCRVIAMQQGSLRANVERLVGECGFAFGAWHIGNDPDWIVDWIVDEPRIIEIENQRGVAGLLEMLADNYSLHGVHVPGDPGTIDFYRESGVK